MLDSSRARLLQLDKIEEGAYPELMSTFITHPEAVRSGSYPEIYGQIFGENN